MTENTPGAVKVAHYRPCGGCGAAGPDQRCIGCFHDFGSAMQAAMAGREVRVKALEWQTWPADGSTSSVVGYPRRYRRLRALTRIGAYFINEGLGVGDVPHFYVDLSGDQIWDGDTLEEAKAVAQADYERRILFALEPAGAQEGADQKPAEKPCVIPFGYSCEVCGGDELNCHGAAKPAPAPAADVAGLVKRNPSLLHNVGARVGTLRAVAAYLATERPQGWANPLVADVAGAADAIEALQAEVGAQKARADDMHRRAQQAEAPKMAARDVANKMWNFVWKAGERYHKARARATAAEAEAAALRAEVDAARQFVKRHPSLSLIDLAEFEAFLKVPAALDAALGKAESPADTKAER